MTSHSRFDLITPLSRDEVVRRLRSRIDAVWKVFGEKSIVGRVRTSSFRLNVRLTYRNSFQSFLYGRLIDENAGTRLKCVVRIHPFSLGFMILWFSLVGLSSITSISMIARDGLHASVGLGLFVPFGMIAFGIGLIWFCRWLAQGEVDQLREFLEETLDAAPAD